jgi:hypothetical protein
MEKMITVFLPFHEGNDFQTTLQALLNSGSVKRIIAVGSQKPSSLHAGIEWLNADGFFTTAMVKEMALMVNTDYTLVYSKSLPLELGQNALARMMSVCNDSNAGMVYSDYFEKKEGVLRANPVIEYQDGSLRDDFNFGSVILYCSQALKEAAGSMTSDYNFAGLYDLRLRISQKHRLVHIPEMLYTELEMDTRKSGEKMFDYVDPKNRQKQIEMEMACSEHLKVVGAWLEPKFKSIEFNREEFEFEASVIVPVKNRQKTIADAVNSVLSQKTAFKFNLIIVDNYSTDGTTEIISAIAANDNRVIHIIPERKDLGIGGCWNEGVNHPKCGKFAIQLDSDDLYIDNNVIKRVVDAFYEQQCAMVVGSYMMVNFKLEEIPPGLIDHREWTPDNGRNNALRINGLGAPRAFYTPVLRDVKVPNVSYGEDYALGLNISRHYQIGRIYEPLYLCRRWDENSDASLDVVKMNNHNFYKDKIRTLEFWARQQYVKKGKLV